MIFTKTFKYRLRPSRKENGLLAQFAGASRWIFNWGLHQRSTLWKEKQRSQTLFDQNNALVALKQNKLTSWLKDTHSQVLQQALGDLNQAFDHFFLRIKNHETPGYPHFRCKGEHDSFRYPQGVKVLKNHVWLPKIGWVRFRKYRLKAKNELSAHHAKIRNHRKDRLHKLSTYLVKSHDKIVVESLQVKKLLVSAPKSLARSISGAGWREFLQMLKYKCEEAGKQFRETERYFPSTKQCFRCRKLNEISLSTREYQCDCGFRIHRDHNAALNLKAAGTSV